jgi:hypothetical protein
VGDVAEGLVEIHDRGILHRDIKPANILLDESRDEALLGDFGLAAHFQETGKIAGTRGYIAPEVADGVADVKSDVFSLAATLFCLVSGRRPFDADDLVTSLRQAKAGLLRPVPALRHVPAAVEEVILAGLEPVPENRIDLPTFIDRLRGAHLQALADQLRKASARSPVRLNVSVWTAKEPDLVFQPAEFQRQPAEPHRSMECFSEPSPSVFVQTGDLVRFEVIADASGFLTVLNLGSAGDLTVVLPNSRARDNRVYAGVPHRVTVKMTPPPGTDRAAFIWTRQPDRLTPEQWSRRIEGSAGENTAPEPTRGMDFVLHETESENPEAWSAEVLAVVHRAPPSAERGALEVARGIEVAGHEGESDRGDACADETLPRGSQETRTASVSEFPVELGLARPRAKWELSYDPVDCSVFAPPSVAQGETVIVQVFAHVPPLTAATEKPTGVFGEQAERRGLVCLEADIPRGEKLLLHLAAPGLKIDDPVRSLLWQGCTESAQFAVSASPKCPKRSVVGTVIVGLGEHHVPVGHVKFNLAVTRADSASVSYRAEPAGEVAHRYRKAFVSYASEDRAAVMKQVRLLTDLKIDCFQKVLELDPGNRWEQALYRQIDACDLFLLFWSSAAKKSPWILEEVRYALRRKGDEWDPPELMPVMIEGPPAVGLPQELKHPRFSDRLGHFMVRGEDESDARTLSRPD